MPNGSDLLNRKAIACTIRADISQQWDKGTVISYCDAPMVHIRRADGSTFWWRADLCLFPDTNSIDVSIETLRKELKEGDQHGQ